MEARHRQKLKLLYIVDILQKHSDEEHPINASEICDKLSDYGVCAERKAIYNDIDMLILYGYDIIKTSVPRRGYFLASRLFELPEIYLLSDAVKAADFITPKKTRDLIAKLDSMLSDEQARKREKRIYIDVNHKFKNEEIYYSIDKINEAIEDGVKISFKYTQRQLSNDRKIVSGAKSMVISPYALLWQNDRYYLVGNNEKYDNLIHLRLDKIRSVQVMDEPSRHFSEVSPYTDSFDVADYTAKTFNMYGGELQKIELCCSKSILDQIIDQFSDSIFVYKVTDETFSFSTNALVSDGLISWILQFGADIKVTAPESLRDMVKNRIDELKELYN